MKPPVTLKPGKATTRSTSSPTKAKASTSKCSTSTVTIQAIHIKASGPESVQAALNLLGSLIGTALGSNER